MLKENLKFLASFLAKPGKVGSILPSSQALARALVKELDLERHPLPILELGPGTGPVTRAILEVKPKGLKYLGVDLDPKFVDSLKKQYGSEDVNFIAGSAENLRELALAFGISGPVHIISALPWSLFPSSLRRSILGEIEYLLQGVGSLVTFGYWHARLLSSGRTFEKELREYFSVVKTPFVVFENFPPALVFSCSEGSILE